MTTMHVVTTTHMYVWPCWQSFLKKSQLPLQVMPLRELRCPCRDVVSRRLMTESCWALCQRCGRKALFPISYFLSNGAWNLKECCYIQSSTKCIQANWRYWEGSHPSHLQCPKLSNWSPTVLNLTITYNHLTSLGENKDTNYFHQNN